MLDQIVEVLNEVVYLILMMFLAKNHSESQWTKTSADAFIGVVLSQLWILFLVPISNLGIKLIRNGKKSNENK